MQNVGENIPQSGVTYYAKVGEAVIGFDHQLVTGEEVKIAANLDCAEDFDLYLERAGCEQELIPPDGTVDLASYGIERFHWKEKTGVTYTIKVDGTVFTFDHRMVTGREILKKVGKSTDEYDLNMKLHGGERREVRPDQKVDLGENGIEKFHTIPKKRTDGRGGEIPPPLGSEDLEYLNALGLEWEATHWQGNILVIIRRWPLPPGYSTPTTDVALIVPLTYPSAQIDMFYFHPGLQRADGVMIKAIENQIFNDQNWQRWSRHRTSESLWRPGIDDLSTHLVLMNSCLRDELGR